MQHCGDLAELSWPFPLHGVRTDSLLLGPPNLCLVQPHHFRPVRSLTKCILPRSPLFVTRSRSCGPTGRQPGGWGSRPFPKGSGCPGHVFHLPHYHEQWFSPSVPAQQGTDEEFASSLISQMVHGNVQTSLPGPEAPDNRTSNIRVLFLVGPSHACCFAGLILLNKSAKCHPRETSLLLPSRRFRPSSFFCHDPTLCYRIICLCHSPPHPVRPGNLCDRGLFYSSVPSGLKHPQKSRP